MENKSKCDAIQLSKLNKRGLSTVNMLLKIILTVQLLS